MNKDQVKGRVDEAKGKVKEATGVILDDKGMEMKGNIQKNVGKARKAMVILRRGLRKTNKTSTATKQQPDTLKFF
ncbi:MAG: CsbD family protein [Methylococcales bacterium]|nr:CsbD family protein [Methylococcales bacterium]